MKLGGDSLANSVKLEMGLAARIERGSAQRARAGCVDWQSDFRSYCLPTAAAPGPAYYPR